jgi:hypothetical protein
MTLSAEDRLDILDLIGRADQLATRRDADAYADLFTADAVLDGSQGVHPAAELRSAVGPIWAAEGPATLHLTLNPVIDAGAEPDEAVVSSILLIVDPATPITIRTAAAITQTVRRTGGTWRVTRRTVAPAAGRAGGAGAAGGAGGEGATGGADGEAGPSVPG